MAHSGKADTNFVPDRLWCYASFVSVILNSCFKYEKEFVTILYI